MLRKSLLCAVMLLCVRTPLFAQTRQDFANPQGNAPIVIPFGKTTGPTSLIPVDVMIHGKGPYHFMLDTGSPYIVLSTDLAAELGIKPTATQKISTDPGNIVIAGRANLDSIQFGGASVENLTCDITPMPIGVPFRGILGADVFLKYVVTINYAFRLLTLSDPKTFTYQGQGFTVPLTFDLNDPCPMMTAEVDGIRARFLLDTGADEEMGLSGGFVQRNKIKTKYQSKLRKNSIETVTGEEQDTVTREPTLTLGKSVLLYVPTELQEPENAPSMRGDGLIGGEILRRFTVTFDYSHLNAWFEPNGNFASPYPHDRSGLTARYEPSAYIVRSVDAHSPAAKARLKAGDRILKIDGTDAAQIDLLQFRGLIRQPVGTVLHLTVQSDGKTREVTLTLSEDF